MHDLIYYLWVVLLLFGATISWSTNFFALPGNWGIVALAALFVWVVPAAPEGPGLAWRNVFELAAIAGVGEVIEFFAGAFGAAKKGASKRAMALALVGTVTGSIFGAIGGLPLPVAGPVLGALIGGACGAFAGAYLGEMWKHGGADKSVSVGWGAAVGRVLGTLGKLAAGAVMLVALAVQALT